jgi:CDP-glycerol glycerophosphotransferase
VNIVYTSFRGHFSDNPRAIYEELRTRHIDATHTWVVAEHLRPIFPVGVRTVPFGSRECIAALEAADLVIANDCISLPWRKRPDATYLQTWHGTPLKRIHHDMTRRRPSPGADADVERWDVLLSPNRVSTDRLRRAFRFEGPVLETGYPRNDLLSSRHRDQVRAAVRGQLGIPDGATAVLYTPTWRDDLVLDATGPRDFDFLVDLDDFTARLGRDHVLLLRLHQMVRHRLDVAPGSAVRDVSSYPDVRDLYLAADVMVTDYSSTMFDFPITDKPLLLYTPDLARYRDRIRGFYFDLAEVAPTPLLGTSEELVDALADVDRIAMETVDRYAAFREGFCHLEDGQSTQRVLDLLAPAGAPTTRPMTAPREMFVPAGLAGSPPSTIHIAGGRRLRVVGPAVPVQAVLLAAGMGTRLGRTEPKPLTPLRDGRSILHRQLDGLREVLGSAVPITAVVGYRHDLLMAAAPELTFSHNPDYATTNTSKSLLRGLLDSQPGGVLWLNGDVVFDPAVLDLVLPHLQADESVVCVDTNTVADEEVKYTLDDEGCIRELSKTVVGGLGEAVGINYVSGADKATLIEHLRRCADQDYFERAIETAIEEDGLCFRPVDISAYAAVEVDFETDLHRANALLGGMGSGPGASAEAG